MNYVYIVQRWKAKRCALSSDMTKHTIFRHENQYFYAERVIELQQGQSARLKVVQEFLCGF